MLRTGLVLGILAAATTALAARANLPGRIRVEGEPGRTLRIRATTDSNVTLLSAAAVYARRAGSVEVLGPATFAIRPGSSYYIRFDAADSNDVIEVSATGGIRFGFGSLGSRYRGVSVVCGSPRGSGVRPLPFGATLADRTCPE